ncbi:zf-HC2 domain-containing protein [Streptomyces sp. P9(2023)]|uniref:anti-sigma factor family protein n=1 Tax=Streptomyces sp. P9(2023) TaxID=3064394 RepID=UPI0028F41832|nr:zf-HC2 domain-containing protein [Streptomyces sp. P9(2023)]MDT9691856.1 zf-HC2 domain-containing protein [Streptomyces sp. P9(2023)]
MNCDEFVDLVTAFLDGALPPQEDARFIEHLTLCEGCETYLSQFRQTIATLGELPTESISAGARSELLAAFKDWQRG